MKNLILIVLAFGIAVNAMGHESLCGVAYSVVNQSGAPVSRIPIVPPSQPVAVPHDLTAAQKKSVFALGVLGYSDFKPIGGGGMGTVVRAQKDGKYYAFKIAKEGEINAAALEAEFFYLDKIAKAHALESAAAKLKGEPPPKNPFPTEVELIKEEGIPPVLRMEFLAWDPKAKGADAGEPAVTLHTLIQKGHLTFEQKVKIADGVRRAVAQLHRYGIVSRDIKPGNILVDINGNVKLADFGLSAEIGQPPRGASDPAFITGTHEYMAPEQRRGEKPIPEHDLYSMGQTLMELFVPPNKLQEYKIARVPYPDAGNWGAYLDFGAPPEGTLQNKNLAIALSDYRHRTPAQYDEGIVNALKLPDANFLIWYGQQMKVGESAAATERAAEKILSSPTLIEAFPKGLGLTKAQAEAIEKAVEKQRGPALVYRSQATNGDPKTVAVPAEVANPWGHFKKFDERVKKVKETPALQP